MYPLSIEIYKNMIKYFFDLIYSAEKGNQIISCGMNECLTLVNRGGKCWLTSALYLSNLVGINPDMEQLHSISNGEVLSSIIDKLKIMLILKKSFSMKLQNPQNLSHTGTSKRNLGKKSISMKLSTTNIDQRLPNSESRLIRFQLKVACMCPLCVSNNIDDEKHYIFHCTNPKLTEIRKTFICEIQ